MFMHKQLPEQEYVEAHILQPLPCKDDKANVVSDIPIVMHLGMPAFVLNFQDHLIALLVGTPRYVFISLGTQY
jgi:hypothetical protein